MEPALTFGPRLRQERERRQISLTSIAETTKISRSLLEALERDDVSRWPTGIFRRSFVRAYAQAIGLNADEIVREFLDRFPEPSAHPVPNDPPSATSTSKRPSGDRVEIVLRFSVPRAWVSWVSRLTALAGFVPRRQN